MFTVQILHPQHTYRYNFDGNQNKFLGICRDIFWIKVPTDIVKTEKFQKQVYVPEDFFTDPFALEDTYEMNGHCYFWCPIRPSDDDRPFLCFRVMPYSAMNDYKNDTYIYLGPPTKGGFNEPEGVKINSLDELPALREKITRASRTSFFIK